MGLLSTATLNWLDSGCCDVKYLDIWDNASLNKIPSSPSDPGWQNGRFTIVLGSDSSGALFHQAAERLMRYELYPEKTLSYVGDHTLLGQHRRLQLGDRIVQRMHLWRLWGRPLLDFIGISEVTQVIADARQCGFTYVTAVPHVIQERWSARLTWFDDGLVHLRIHTLFRPSPQEPKRNHRLLTSFWQEANQACLPFFKGQLRQAIALATAVA